MRLPIHLLLIPICLGLSATSAWANEEAFLQMLGQRKVSSCETAVGYQAAVRDFLNAQTADNLTGYNELSSQFVAAIRNGTQESKFRELVRRASHVYELLDRYLVGKMTPDGVERFLKGESTIAVDERAKHRLSARGGLFCGLNSNGDCTPFSTSSAVAYTEDYKPIAIFVMDERGNFYVSNYQLHGQFHHSALLAGLPVAIAGGITIESGKVTYMSNGSGHYRSSVFQLAQAIRQLEKLGLIGAEGILVKAFVGGIEHEFMYHPAIAQ